MEKSVEQLKQIADKIRNLGYELVRIGKKSAMGYNQKGFTVWSIEADGVSLCLGNYDIERKRAMKVFAQKEN